MIDPQIELVAFVILYGLGIDPISYQSCCLLQERVLRLSRILAFHVILMHTGNHFLQLCIRCRHQFQGADVVAGVLTGIVISQFGLDDAGQQKGGLLTGALQSPLTQVTAKLQESTDVISRDFKKGVKEETDLQIHEKAGQFFSNSGRIRRVELDTETEHWVRTCGGQGKKMHEK